MPPIRALVIGLLGSIPSLFNCVVTRTARCSSRCAVLLLCLVTFGCRTVPLPPKTSGATTLAQEPPAPPSPPLTTPQESLAAKPSWVEAGSYAPQYSRALPLSTQADREVSKALLSCTVETRHNLDTFGWNDLLTEAQFGDAPGLVARGPEDSMRMTFTAPLLTLRAGDGFRFDIVDRDVTTDEPIVTIRDVFDGRLPLVASREEATVECDVVPTSVVHKQVAARVRDVQAELRLLRPAVPLPVESDWGHRARMKVIERLVEDAAGLVGWADPRVASLLDAVASEKAKMLAAATQWIDQQLQDGMPPAQAQTVIDAVLKARVLEVSSEAQPGTEGCRFMTRLELTNRRQARRVSRRSTHVPVSGRRADPAEVRGQGGRPRLPDVDESLWPPIDCGGARALQAPSWQERHPLGRRDLATRGLTAPVVAVVRAGHRDGRAAPRVSTNCLPLPSGEGRGEGMLLRRASRTPEYHGAPCLPFVP